MTQNCSRLPFALEWSTACQGDIVELSSLPCIGADGQLASIDTPYGVCLMSQTCNLVRVSEGARVLVAPVKTLAGQEWSNVKRGRKPLLVIVGADPDEHKVADVERLISLPRQMLDGRLVVDRSCTSPSGRSASLFASRLARAFSRFAFPDEIHPVFSRFQRKIVDTYGKQSSFARVLKVIEEFRVSCESWEAEEIELTVHCIVPSNWLPPADEMDASWEWSVQTVNGAKRNEQPKDLSLERLSHLIVANQAVGNFGALVTLWRLWEEHIQHSYFTLQGEGSDRCTVSSTFFSVVSTTEFTFDMYVASEALDFSTLTFLDQERGE